MINNMMKKSGFDKESISMLIGDEVIGKVEECVGELYDLYNRSLLPNDLDIRRNKKSDNIMSKMEQLLSNRTGITFRFYGTNHGAHCIVTPPPGANIISPDSDKTFKQLKNIFDKWEVKPLNTVDKIKVQNDNKEIFQTLHKSMLSLEEDMMGKNIKVDFKNAKIKGLNKDVITLVGIPFKIYFSRNIYVKEIMAILMHEVGHVFNIISTMHQFSTTVVTTADALVNNEPNEAEIVSMAENVYNVKFKDGNDLFKKVFNDEISYVSNEYVNKNNEVAADQFATRFGYGKELAVSLAKLHDLNIDFESAKKEEKKDDFVVWYFKTLRAMYIAYFTALVILILVSVVISVMLIILPIMILLLIGKLIGILVTSGLNLASFRNPLELKKSGLIDVHNYDRSYNTGSVYDDLKQRLRRIKIDIIRQMRIYKIDKSTEERLLSQLSSIESIMIGIEQKRSIFTLLKHTMLFEREEVGTAKFFMNVEEIIENDFHARDRQLKEILRRK